MALRKLAGPFEFKDLFGDYHHAYIGPWFDELDGFLANSSWRLHPDPPTGGYTVAGQGIVQLDGVFTPRVSRSGTTSVAGPNVPYDRVSRRISYYDAGHTAAPDPSGYFLTIYRGVDWLTLKAPYTPETVSLTFTADGVHQIWPHAFALLPDRVIFLGKVLPGVFTDPREYKIFSVPYASGPFVAPTLEHSFQTSLVPGSEDWEDWDSGPFDSFIQSGTPERSVFLLVKRSSGARAIEYDFVQKKVIGWVRRLGTQPELSTEYNGPEIAAYSTKHKVWVVEDEATYPYESPLPNEAPVGPLWGHGTRRRMWIFADEATPTNLSNPVALSPTRSGEAVRYRVRLTGADYEPCIGHRVNWTCLALGTVLIPQSVTDADGYAETQVAFPPRQDGPVEGTTITAEVIF